MALLSSLRRLIGDLCTYLSIRDGGGVQRFVAGLPTRGGHTDLEVVRYRRRWNWRTLFELTRKLAGAQTDRPVVGVRLLARELPPFVPAARDLFDTRPQQQPPRPQLRERLRARLGDDAVHRVARLPVTRVRSAPGAACRAMANA